MKSRFNVRISKISTIPGRILMAAETDDDVKSFVISGNSKVILDKEEYAGVGTEPLCTFNNNYALYSIGETGVGVNKLVKDKLGVETEGAVLVTRVDKGKMSNYEIDSLCDFLFEGLDLEDSDDIQVTDEVIKEL